MAELTKIRVDTTLKVNLELTEAEVRALDGIFGYNVDNFLKVFYERMGKAYVQPHEAGVRLLHKTIRGTLSEPLAKIDAARKAIKECEMTKAPKS